MRPLTDTSTSACGSCIAMPSSLVCRPQRGMECVRTWEAVRTCSGNSSYLHCHHTRAVARHGKALSCGAASRKMGVVGRSAAQDLAPLNHMAANHRVGDSGISASLSSTGLDTNLLCPHYPPPDAKQQETFPSPIHSGRLVNNSLIFQQTFTIRSYEVRFDRTAPIDTIINLFQETSLNHVGMLDFVGDGMGRTHAMMQHGLIWVVSRMHIEMAQYPAWGDVIQIDSWVRSSGKHGMQRDFLVRDYTTGLTIGRATSNWAMMNLETRRLSRMPADVMAEISSCFLETCVMGEEARACSRIPPVDDSAPLRVTGLQPKVQDLDMNQHVNHVKYIVWMLECLPQSLFNSCELRIVTLEFRRECGNSDILESKAQASNVESIMAPSSTYAKDSFDFVHSLCLSDSGIEVLRGRTHWTPRI